MIKPQPIVKQMANFCGVRTITGRKIETAIMIKNTPEASNNAKYKTDVPDGTLFVAD